MKINKLTDYAEVIDSLHATPKYTNAGYPMVRVVDVNNEFIKLNNCLSVNRHSFDEHNKKYIPQKEDIIITRVGSYGMLGYVDTDEEFCLGQNIAIINPKENSRFLYYYLSSPYMQKIIHRATGGSAYKSISLSDIRNLPIEVDGLNQKEIGDFCYNLDCKIELNNKINTELETIAKTIYEYWFVQFDFPDANGNPYKASGGKMVYNKNLNKEIPEGWQDKTIADWIENDKSGDWGKESKQGNYTEKVSCIRGADINGLNGNGEVKAPERFILEKNTHKLLEHGDLIIEISGGSPTQSTGRMAFITQETLERFENPLICSNFCKAVTLKDETYLYNFVYQWNRLYDAGVLFGWEGKTSGIKNLLFESFVTNYKTVFPKKDIVEKFYEKVKPLHAKKQKNLQENQKLAELRDWLLPMLMNGQVTVKEAQEHINQAAEPQEKYQ